jgi:hypothetical protein
VAGVRRALEQVKRLHDNIESIAEESVSQASPSFVEAQKDQLLQGSNSAGESFRRYRNPDYAKMKNLMNPLPGLGNPDLKLTGQFQRGNLCDRTKWKNYSRIERPESTGTRSII